MSTRSWRRRTVRALAAALLLVASAGTSRAEDVYQGGGDTGTSADLETRVSRLERLIGNTRIGAWLDFVYYDNDKPNTPGYLDPHHFYFYLDSRISEHWQAFAEVEYEHAPSVEDGAGEGEIKLERAYIQYNYNDMARVRGGRFYTPFGYWKPIHWSVNMDTTQKPMIEDNAYVPDVQVGLDGFGAVFPSFSDSADLEIDYSGYFSNGAEHSGTNEPQDSTWGGGADLRFTLMSNYLAGFSFYRQHNPSPRLGQPPNRAENNYGAYLNFTLPLNLVLRGEYLHQRRSGSAPNINGGYVKLRWDMRHDAYLNFRYDHGNDEKSGGGELSTYYTATLGYRPISNVKIRLEYTRKDFDATGIPDYNQWSAWIGYVF